MTTSFITSFSSSTWKKISDSVTASTTGTVHEIDLADFKFIKYYLTAYNEAQDKVKTLELNVINENAGLKDTVTNKLGKQISMSVDVNLSGSTLNLDITNNEAYELQVRLAYLTLE